MKRILSVFLVLLIVSCIAFQCSFQSSAIAGVDDAVILGVCLDLLAMGITIYSVSEFCQSDTFADFCNSIGNDLTSAFSTIKKGGKLFVQTSKVAWEAMVDWVKSKFNGTSQTIDIPYDVTVIGRPHHITLDNGTTVPYAEWMSNPFFIYKVQSSGNVWGVYCDGENPGVNFNNATLIRVWCTGRGKVHLYQLVNGSWANPYTYNMNYGLTYKDVVGSFYDINLANSSLNNAAQAMQYRTMERVNDSGTALEQSPPNDDPVQEETSTAYVRASSDPTYYPGALQAPAETIQAGESVLVQVPEGVIVDDGTDTGGITTDRAVIGDVIAETTPENVKPKVLTQTASVSTTVDQVIEDTPVAEIEANGDSDLETANKFRLPKSFLEGFPFSIPYSLFVGIQSFAAEPTAPYFDIPFCIPRLGIDEHIVLDLSNLNSLSVVCRALLSLVWVAGLAMTCNTFLKR